MRDWNRFLVVFYAHSVIHASAQMNERMHARVRNDLITDNGIDEKWTTDLFPRHISTAESETLVSQ